MKLFAVASFVLTSLYAASIPWSGNVLNVDNAYSASIPYTEECSAKKSSGNMSLRLAVINMGVMFIVTLLLISHSMAPKGKKTLWPVPVLWISVTLAFVAQMVVFVSLVLRIGVWFLSCRSVSKSEGPCPITKYESVVGHIRDPEQCHFSPTNLIPFSQSDTYISCHNSSDSALYFSQFLRFNMPQYYSRKAICSLGLENELGAIDWCWSWGCSRTCSPDTYYKNWIWFSLDIVSLLVIITGYMILMHQWHIKRDKEKV